MGSRYTHRYYSVMHTGSRYTHRYYSMVHMGSRYTHRYYIVMHTPVTTPKYVKIYHDSIRAGRLMLFIGGDTQIDSPDAF